MRQPKWDKYEAVILLDAYIETLNSDLPKLRIIKRVSADLRRMAANKGVETDEIFRNENGISFQMQSIESAYCGRTVTKPATRLFSEIVAMYKTNYIEYKNLLKEARAMIEGKLNYKDIFSSWLADAVPTAPINAMLASCEKIEQFSLKLKVLKAPLFETTDLEVLKAVQKTVQKNKIFRVVNKKQLKQIDTAMLALIKFVRESNLEKVTEKSTSIVGAPAPTEAEEPVVAEKWQSVNDDAMMFYVRTEQDKRLLAKYPLIYKHVFSVLRELFESGEDGTTVVEAYENTNHIARCADIEDILDNVSWAKCVNRCYSFSEEIAKHEDSLKTRDCSDKTESVDTESSKNVVDFNAIDDYSYTKPISLSYFNYGSIGFSTWTGLYVALFSNLYSDYPHLFKLGMSFTSSGSGRVELCGDELRNKMVEPKQIPGTPLYLETNISAKGILEKIRFLLDLCNVDYENVVIEYQKKSESAPEPRVIATKQNFTEHWGSFDSKGFTVFLRDHEGMADTTCRSYDSAIIIAERFAKEHHFEHQQLLTPDWREAKATVDALFRDPVFIEYNDQQHNRFSAALKKLLIFLHSDTAAVVTTGTTTIAHSTTQSVADESYRGVLVENFRKGFRLNSPIEMRKFKRCYEQMKGKPLDDDDGEIERKIGCCGILFEDKVFTPQTMLGDELREQLFTYIENCFAEGKTALYYQALFNEFSEEFLDYYIYNADMLKAYLSFMLGEDYFFGRSYLAKDANASADPVDEIRTCLKEYVAPMTYDMMFENLSHIPQQKIKQILAYNGEFVSNGRGEYFHVSAVHFSDEEIDNIAEIIDTAIEEKQFLSGNELVAAIQSKYPYTYEKNSAFSVVGLRDAIKYHLSNKFSFSGNIISRLGSSLTMSDVFADYCSKHDSFTLDELNVLANELGTVIYFDPVYENSLRINHNQFVSKKRAHFLVTETDDTLDRFCTGDYISIGKISGFSLFPNAGFPWNEYLLEHYTAAYSNKYSLLHIGFNANKCVGAIVKKSAGFESFDDCIVDVLANSSITLKKQSALQYLCDEGYIARRIYTNIEELLIRATAQRNRKEAN